MIYELRWNIATPSLPCGNGILKSVISHYRKPPRIDAPDTWRAYIRVDIYCHDEFGEKANILSARGAEDQNKKMRRVLMEQCDNTVWKVTIDNTRTYYMQKFSRTLLRLFKLLNVTKGTGCTGLIWNFVSESNFL